MRYTILIALVIVLAQAKTVKYTVENLPQAWEEFQTKYTKNYTAFEAIKRKDNFAANYMDLIKKQELHNRIHHGEEFVFGVTKFFDLSREEFAAQFLNRPNYEIKCEYKMDLSDVTSTPEELDWRSKDVVNDPKDQANCGSCWAFSAVSHIESQWAMKTGKLERFSEQQLVDCDPNSYGCGGGFEEQAVNYFKGHAAVRESDYPYEATDSTCRESQYKGVELGVKGCAEETTKDENEIVKAVAKYGPLAIAVDANGFFNYTGGIMRSGCSAESLNHAINIVGFGTKDGIDYWILRNSWGSDWGENGYIFIERGKNLCAVSEEVVTVVWDN